MRSSRLRGLSTFCSLALIGLSACNTILGLDELSVEHSESDGGSLEAECSSNTDCNPGDDGSGNNAAVCLKPEGRCVPLLSPDCRTLTGDYRDDRSIVIGSLFSLSGAQAVTNLPRQQAAALAVEEINKVGGVPRGATSADGRPLLLVSCDESVDLMRAAGVWGRGLYGKAWT